MVPEPGALARTLVRIADEAYGLVGEAGQWAPTTTMYYRERPRGWVTYPALCRAYGYPATGQGWAALCRAMTGRPVAPRGTGKRVTKALAAGIGSPGAEDTRMPPRTHRHEARYDDGSGMPGVVRRRPVMRWDVRRHCWRAAGVMEVVQLR